MKKLTRKTRGAGRVQALPSAYDNIGLRGGIEVCLKNALTGEDIVHEKQDNVVLYIGRNMLMTRALTTATQEMIQPMVIIGTSTAATDATHTGPQGYYSFQTGGIAQTTQSGGTGQPKFQLTASWDTGALTDTQFNSLGEFCLAFNTASTRGSTGATYLNRYVTGTRINATTSNQLLISFTVSF